MLAQFQFEYIEHKSHKYTTYQIHEETSFSVNIDFFTLIQSIKRSVPLCIRVSLECSTASISKQKMPFQEKRSEMSDK